MLSLAFSFLEHDLFGVTPYWFAQAREYAARWFGFMPHAAPSSRQRATRSLNDGRRSRFNTGFGGVSCVTRPGVVFCNANGGGEFICGTVGTTIGGGGGAGGAVGNGITG
jgi:hypothetical protein